MIIQNYPADKNQSLLNQVEQLMHSAGIPIRDSWQGWDGENFDDASYNDGKSGGKRLFSIEFHDAVFTPQIHFEHIYTLPEGFTSCAYDKFRILLPFHYKDRIDIIVHECVHFLQHNTHELQNSYIINIDKDYNYPQYIEQRCELEAHFVQLMYQAKYGINTEDPVTRFVFLTAIQECMTDHSKRRGLILFAKDNGII